MKASCAVGRTEIDVLRSFINDFSQPTFWEPFQTALSFIPSLLKQAMLFGRDQFSFRFFAQNAPFNPLISRTNSLPQ